MDDDTGRRDNLRERAQRALPFVEFAARHRDHLDPPEPQVPEPLPHRGKVEILLGRSAVAVLEAARRVDTAVHAPNGTRRSVPGSR
jgi:hypothetical protein